MLDFASGSAGYHALPCAGDFRLGGSSRKTDRLGITGTAATCDPFISVYLLAPSILFCRKWSLCIFWVDATQYHTRQHEECRVSGPSFNRAHFRRPRSSIGGASVYAVFWAQRAVNGRSCCIVFIVRRLEPSCPYCPTSVSMQQPGPRGACC